MRRLLLAVFASLALLALRASAQDAGGAALIEIDGAIGPATSGYFEKAHRHAVESGAKLVVLRLDTPGGLDSAMREIIKVILNSPIPVIGYVGPGGARAASAGTYILYACHVAAMAPATNLGAATPIPVGGSAPVPGMPKEKKGEADEPPADAGQTKAVNDAVAYIRSLAEKRGRNADWAEHAVREGVSLTAAKALEQKVVDLIAADIPDLLRKVDRRKVALATGEVTLQSAGLPIEKIEPDWRMKILAVITNPQVAYILLLAGIYGLLLEGYHPGAILPGVVGGICLLLALFAFQVLPVNYVGLALIALGVVLMIAETLAPGFGVMGFGGVVSFVIGSILLMDIDVPGYEISRELIFGIASAAALLLALTLWLIWRARRAPVVTGRDALAGQVVEVIEPFDHEGWALLQGERWRVRARAPFAAGARARVVKSHGLTLDVEPLPPDSNQ